MQGRKERRTQLRSGRRKGSKSFRRKEMLMNQSLLYFNLNLKVLNLSKRWMKRNLIGEKKKKIHTNLKIDQCYLLMVQTHILILFMRTRRNKTKKEKKPSFYRN